MTPDDLFLAAMDAGVLSVDTEMGLVFGSRWGVGRPRGCLNTKGYVVFTLHFDGLRKQIKAHRAVWLAANGSIPEGLMPDHQNRIKSDNRLDNLLLVDDGGNAQNRRTYAGEGNPAAKITREIAEAMRANHASGQSYNYLANTFDVSRSLVAQIVRRELWV